MELLFYMRSHDVRVNCTSYTHTLNSFFFFFKSRLQRLHNFWILLFTIKNHIHGKCIILYLNAHKFNRVYYDVICVFSLSLCASMYESHQLCCLIQIYIFFFGSGTTLTIWFRWNKIQSPVRKRAKQAVEARSQKKKQPKNR